MPIALISDIHGNLEALERVLDDIAGTGARDVRCLGDVVGYGADPEACVGRVREVARTVLMGNHDAVVASIHSEAGFNEAAREAVVRSREALSPESIDYLAGLPLTDEADGLLLTHAHPLANGDWPYIFLGDAIEHVFAETTARWMMVGHTHTPGIGDDEGVVLEHLRSGRVTLDPARRYLMNVGSVGQPRDRDARASWALFDAEAGTFELRRVAYDVESAQRKIRAMGLPDFLAERLARGV